MNSITANLRTQRQFYSLQEALEFLAQICLTDLTQYFVAKGQNEKYAIFAFQGSAITLPQGYKFVCIIRLGIMQLVNGFASDPTSARTPATLTAPMHPTSTVSDYLA